MNYYIFGHKKPDLDSVVAPIALASFLTQQDQKNGNTDNKYIPAITEDINPETKFVFDKFMLLVPEIVTASSLTPEDKVILVDHNEADQRLDNLNPDQICAVYDHHKVNLSLNQPITLITQTYGSSNTLIWELFKKDSLEINPQTATMMLCAILSDTVGLKSSTTTPIDRLAIDDLAKSAGITDTKFLTLEIFKAKSNLKSISDEQVVTNDYKIFEFSGKKVFIGQIETVEQNELISSRKVGLLNTMAAVKASSGANLLFLAITDILNVNTKLLILSPEESAVAVKAFSTLPQDSIQDIGAKMSRKKDIAPAIEKALA